MPCFTWIVVKYTRKQKVSDSRSVIIHRYPHEMIEFAVSRPAKTTFATGGCKSVIYFFVVDFFVVYVVVSGKDSVVSISK